MSDSFERSEELNQINKSLEDYRTEIDSIDSQIVSLFTERMKVAAGMAEYKKAKGLPIYDSVREQNKLLEIYEMTEDELKNYTRRLYLLIFEQSRDYQNKIIGNDTEIS